MGLGNPGAQFIKTRHNVGYRMIDFLMEKFGGEFYSKARYGKVWKGSIYKNTVFMVKPTTFMNLSGKTARWILDREGLLPERMVVFHDDMDLERGRTKLKWEGGDAGHKGIRSIIMCLQTGAFFRVRIGIGRPPKDKDASDHVLADFAPEEEEEIYGALVRITEGMEIWAEKGTKNALNFLNHRD